MAADYLRYANQGATRNLPLAPQLVSALSYLPQLGVTAEVFSGGQPGKGSGQPRVGSVRHDHGNAADVRFFKDGRRLDWRREDDRPIFEAIVAQGRSNGITGWGAGPGYMEQGTMHVGFGSPGVWGAGGKSANAPDWLRRAYNGAPSAPTVERAAAEAQPKHLQSTSSIPAAGDKPMPTNYGGLGGLGGASTAGAAPKTGWRGVLGSNEFGDILQSVGLSLLSSPSNAPFSGMADTLPAIQNRRDKQSEREFQREQQRQDRLAMAGALVDAGIPQDKAWAYAGNANAASLALEARQLQTQTAQQEAAQTARSDFLSSLGGNGAVTEPAMVAPVEAAERVPVPSATANPTLLQPRSLTDALPQPAAAQPAAPAPAPTAGSGNRTFDALVQQRDKVAQQLIGAPDAGSLARGKLVLDQLDSKIERYKPKDLKLETLYDDATGREYRGYIDPTTKQPVRVGGFKAPSGPMVEVNTGSNSGKFAEESDKAAAARLGEIVSSGNAAPQMMGDMQQLAELGTQIQTGKGAQALVALGPYAQALGIELEGLGPAQAYKAITSRLAPQMRPAGSGAASDFDARQFLESLPSIGTSPEGNEIINGTFQAISQNKIEAAELARQAQRGLITWQEAEDRITKLPNPYERFKGWKQPPGSPTATAAPKATVIDGYTIEEEVQ